VSSPLILHFNTLIFAFLSVDTHVLVSTIRRTIALQLGNHGQPAASCLNKEHHAFVEQGPTLAAMNMVITEGADTHSSTAIAQVVRGGVNVVEHDGVHAFASRDFWKPSQVPEVAGQDTIVAASLSPGRIAIALEGGAIVLLRLNKDMRCYVEKAG
jgi:hypothetical protein